MFHLSAFFQSIDPANALTNINAVREEQLFTNGIDLRVHKALTFLIGEAALINDSSAARAQVSSPSLRVRTNHDIESIGRAAVFGSPPEGIFHPESPLPLVADEAVNFAVQSDPAAAVAHYGLIWFSDGPHPPLNGEIFTLRATSAIQQVAGAWVNGNLTLSQVLATGRYQVVGFRARSTDGVGARLLFQEQTPRPGVPMVNTVEDLDPWWMRYGRMGVYGEFDNTVPPTVDVLGGVAAAQTYLLDLIRVA